MGMMMTSKIRLHLGTMVVKLKYTVFATITMEKNVVKVQSNNATSSGTRKC
jgi:hypothetical protein